MAKRLGRLKERFMSKLRRPFHYKRRVHKNKDGLSEPIVNSSECETHDTNPRKSVSYNCLKADQNNRNNNNADSPCFQRGGLFSVEEHELETSDANRTFETAEEEEELSKMKQPQAQTRRRSSAFQRLMNWVKPEHRRHAICEQMEREIETSGVSLRQYRKFLTTTYILHDLKML